MATSKSKKQPKAHKSKNGGSTAPTNANSRNPRKEMEALATSKQRKDIEEHINKENASRNDPENADSGDFGDGTMAGAGRRKVDVDEELGDNDDAPLRPGTLRPIDETFEQGKYAGERVNVDSVYSMDDEEEDEENEEDSSVQSEEEPSDEGESAEEGARSSVGDTASEQGDEQTENQRTPTHSGAEEINDELAALEAEDEAQFIQMSKSSHVDREKGQGVKHQVHFFERLLESRILTQRLVKDANRFPRQDAFRGLIKQDTKLRHSFNECSASLKDTLTQCLELQTLSLPSTDSIKENCHTKDLNFDDLSNHIVPGKKRKRDGDEDEDEDQDQPQVSNVGIDTFWNALDTLHQVSLQPMKSILDKEYERVNHGKGRNKAMKALQQPISKQVDEILMDPERCHRRAHIRFSNSSVLGEDQTKFNSATASQEWDREVYDDSEFYQTLLKEFLQSKSTDDAMAAQSSISGNLVTSKKSQQQKKQVDRKASKGRKLRFAVQPKLVNFMVPEKHSAYDEHSDSNVITGDGSTINLDNLVRSLFRGTTA